MSKEPTKKNIRKVSYASLHKLSAGVSLLAFFVIVGAGISAGASVISMTMRAFIVIVTIGLVTKIVTKVLANYEEIQSGQT